jgi:hypothetical protein
MVAFSFEAQRSKQVYYVTADGHIHELSVILGGAWGHADLTGSFGLPPVPQGGGLFGGFAFEAQRSKQVYYSTADGHIHEYGVILGGGWGHADLTQSFDLPPVPQEGILFGGFAFEAQRSKQVYYVNAADGHIHEYGVIIGGGWGHADLTQSFGLPPVPQGRGLFGGFAFEAQRSKQVYYSTADGHIHEYQVNLGGGWFDTDLTTLTNAPPPAPALGFPAAFAFEAQTSKQVYYSTADGDIHELLVSLADLTALTGAPPVVIIQID